MLVAAVAAAVIGVVLVTRDGDDAERREIIDREIAGVWRAAGLAEGDVRNLAYDITRRRGNSRCGDLPEDEHWFASRSSLTTAPVPEGGERQAEAVTRWLDQQGYTTYVYRAASGGHLVDGIDNDRGLWVKFTTERDGFAEVMVRLTPCTAGPYLPPDPPGVWTPVEG